MATKLTTVKRQSYTVSDKLRIIQFAEQHGNRAAEHEFGVFKSNVRLWPKVKKTSRIDASTEVCYLKCGITNNLDGSEDELVYNSTENTHELDDSSIENLFESDPESEFEGFVV